jgi:TP901 family phage tail tape measure protein
MSLGRSSDLSVDISGDASGFERAVKSAETATQRAQRAALNYDASLAKLGGDIARLEKQIDDDLAAALERQHRAMDRTGKGLVVFGAAVAAGLGLAGREAMKWETAWTGVTKTVDGSEQEMAVLEGQLRSLAKTLPSSHEEIAAVAEAAGQLGVERESVAKFTRTMIDLGETTNLTAQDAATGLARFSNIMGTSISDVDRLGSIIVGLGNNFETTEAEILAMSMRIAGTGRQIGLTEGEVMGLATALSSVGIEAEAGGTAISQVMTRIQTAVSDGGAELEKFAQVAGVTGPEFARIFGSDAAGALDMFITGLGNVSASGGDTLATLNDLDFTQIRQRDSLLRLSAASDKVIQAMEQGNAEWAVNNALQEEAAQRYATTEARLQTASNALRDNAIDIGAYVLPALAAAADAVANLAAFFTDVPGPVKNTIVVLAALAAAAALVGGAFLIAVPKVHAFNTAVAGLEAGGLKTAGTRLSKLGGLLMGPWGIALAATTVAVGLWAAKQGEAARMADALRATLDEQTGAITANTQEWALSEFADSGVMDAAETVGVSLATVTKAALKNKDAIAELATAHRAYEEQVQAVVSKGGKPSDELRAQGSAWTLLNDEITSTAGSLTEAQREAEMERAALDELGGSTKDAAAATGALTGVIDRNTDGIIDNTDALIGNIEEMRNQRSEALRAANAQIGYQAAIDDARKALKDNGKTLDITTEKGRANKTALLGMASGWNDLSDKAKNAPGAHRAAIESFVNMATKMGMGEERARALARRIMEIPDRKVKVEADTGDSEDRVRRLRDLVAGLSSKTITVHTKTGAIGHLADGGMVTGPGGPRDDRILTRLSNGEFVVNAESTSRHRDLLEAINAKRFADGGFVGGKASRISGGFVLGQLSLIDPTPNLRAYNRAVRQQAAALRELQREQRQFDRQRKEQREADKAVRVAGREVDRAKTDKARKAAEEALREAQKKARLEAKETEKAENQLTRAKDRHAKATGRVKDAVDAYAAAQAAAVDNATSIATNARAGGSIFGGDFVDPASVSQRIQATLARVREFHRLRSQLVARGIHPALLAELDAEGPTEAGLLFARAAASDQAALTDLNRQSAALVTESNRLGAQTAALHGPGAGREVRYGAQSGQTIVINQVVNAPQNMNPRQVGDQVASRVVARLRGGG